MRLKVAREALGLGLAIGRRAAHRQPRPATAAAGTRPAVHPPEVLRGACCRGFGSAGGAALPPPPVELRQPCATSCRAACSRT